MEISGGGVGGGGGERIPGTSRDSDKFSTLYKAALTGDWEMFEKNMENVDAIISEMGETALHVAAIHRNAIEFIRRLVREMQPEVLALQNIYGCTALHEAAAYGNTDAAKIILKGNPDVLHMVNNAGELAVVLAGRFHHKETFQYLVSVSKPIVGNNPFQGQLDVDTLVGAIVCENFGVALDLIENYPELVQLLTKECVLSILDPLKTAFSTSQDFNWWESFIYRCTPPNQLELKVDLPPSDDVENANVGAPTYKCPHLFHITSGVGKQFESKIWNVAEYIVPGVIRRIRDKKKTHKQAYDFVICLFRELASLPRDEAVAMRGFLFLWAAEHGFADIVELMMERYPLVTGCKDDKGRTAMHLAVENRFEKIVSLIYKSSRRHLFTTVLDDEENSLAHACAMLAPIHRLNAVPNAFFQMHWESQWFNKMQKIVPPLIRNRVNKDGKTAEILFSEQHEKMKADGEKSLNDMTTAYFTFASLVASLMFASSFTNPGGISSLTGNPSFSEEPAFIVFSITYPLAFIASIISVVLLQSISTSRFAEADFLYKLPMRLMLSSLSFLFSVILLVVGFIAALYLVSQKLMAWVLLLVIGIGWIPAVMVVFLQFHLVVYIFNSINGPAILGEKD